MSNSSCLITIIVPVHNQEKCITRCLDSILNQTYSNTEIIIVNDGSTDKTAPLINEIALHDKRVKVIHQKNSGPGNARNAGLDIATGEYIGFVDSDDYIEKDMYQAMIDAALMHDADIVQCGYEHVTPENISFKRSNYAERIIEGAYSCAFEFSAQKDINNYLPCKLIKRSLIGNKRLPSLFASEDTFFLLKVFCHCNRTIIINKHFYKYVQFSESLSRSSFSLKKMDVIKSGKLMHKYITQKFPDLACYWSLFVVLNSVKLYSWSIKLTEFKTQQDELIATFKEYYPIIRKSKVISTISLKSRLALDLFYIWPKAYALLFNWYH